MSILKIIFVSFLLFLTFVTASTASDDGRRDLAILRMTPDGVDVPEGRQVVIQFNRPVVPIGRMDRDVDTIPVDVEPKLECQWRWLNTSALACNLDEKNELKPATQYTVTVRPGITAEDGATIKDVYTHRFTTTRPDVRYAWFREWLSPRMPIMRLTFNQPVTRRSLEASLSIVSAEAEDGKRYVVDADPDPEDKESPILLPVPGMKMIAVFDSAKPQKSDDDLRKKNGEE